MSEPIVIVTPPAPPPVVVVAPPTGPTGPPGRDAPLPTTYDLVAVSTWTLAHTFGYPPEVQLVDANNDNRRVYASAAYLDDTHVSVMFPTPFTGKVILR